MHVLEMIHSFTEYLLFFLFAMYTSKTLYPCKKRTHHPDLSWYLILFLDLDNLLLKAYSVKVNCFEFAYIEAGEYMKMLYLMLDKHLDKF